jgi:Uncharacterized conserved protein (DUF2190)
VANECIPLYRPGGDLTVLTTAAVTGKTFVAVSATRDATTGHIKAATATAAGGTLGVAARDIASGAYGPVICTPGIIVPVTAGGTIAFGAEVEVGANGKAVTIASGVAVGRAVEAGTNNNDILVKLYGK